MSIPLRFGHGEYHVITIDRRTSAVSYRICRIETMKASPDRPAWFPILAEPTEDNRVFVSGDYGEWRSPQRYELDEWYEKKPIPENRLIAALNWAAGHLGRAHCADSTSRT